MNIKFKIINVYKNLIFIFLEKNLLKLELFIVN